MADKDCRYCGGAGKFQVTSACSDGAWATCFCSRAQYPTEDAYNATCRALRWRMAELRAHGVEPITLPLNAPPEPPEGYDFGASGAQSDREVAIGEHAFNAGWDAAVTSFDRGDGFREERCAEAWSNYTPPEDLCGGGAA